MRHYSAIVIFLLGVVLVEGMYHNAAAQGCFVDTCTSCDQPPAGVDNDYDQIPDSLEYELAYKFLPSIQLQGYDYDLAVSYVYHGLPLPYSVQPFTGGVCDQDHECVEIRYGIAYTYDFGDNEWYIRYTVDHPHEGDSELYAVLLQRTTPWATAATDSASWQMIRDFTSAHWGTTTDSSRMASYGYCPPPSCTAFQDGSTCNAHSQCNWSESNCWGIPSDSTAKCGQFFNDGDSCYYYGCNWIPPACHDGGDNLCLSNTPRSFYYSLYASERKHGLYHSDAECDSGAWSADECPSNAYDMKNYTVGKLQNVGSLQHHEYFDTDMQAPNLCDKYRFWDDLNFGESTSYRENFTKPINWNLPASSSLPTAPVGNPFSYGSPRDEYLTCYGIAGSISSNCWDVADFNDKQMCYAMSDRTQSPCTQMTDRNLQLACYGMSVAPNYPSNCRDITDANLQHFCYGVSGSDTSQCAALTDPNTRQLCYAMATNSSSYCGSITTANDRQFCYGVSAHANGYCASIQ